MPPPSADGDQSAADDEGDGAAAKRALGTARTFCRPDSSGRVARSPRAPGLHGPGRSDRRERSRRARRERKRTRAGTPTRRTAPSVSDCRGLAAVEAGPEPCRAQRRAGALHGGRSAAQPAGSIPAASARATAPRKPPPGPTALHRTERSGGGSMARDRPEARRRAGARRAARIIQDVTNASEPPTN